MPTTVELARLLRYWSLTSTTTAGSGHPTSALSAADLMAVLFFDGHFRFRLDEPAFANNDRLIFSKGHAAPLFYALWAAAGGFPAQQLNTLRKANSVLQGHPTMDFPFTEAATGSLGQGLSIGLGMALNAQRFDRLSHRVFVLLGDGELAEGNIWEALQLAGHYKVGNLVGIADINRLEQTGETQLGHDLETYRKRVEAFGWRVIVIDGHDHAAIASAYEQARQGTNQPVMILAKTLKGKGVTKLENQENRHGKAVPADQLAACLAELGPVDENWRGTLTQPEAGEPPILAARPLPALNKPSEPLSPRRAYGQALVRLGEAYPHLVVLDADLSNSTFSETFKARFPERFLEMYIAEQNMVATAVGLAARGKLPFVSTFGAFFTRAFDQIRLAGYSLANVKFCGSHVGVSIGEDGVSQMGLEDIALFRTIFGCAVLYPSDAVSMERLVETAAEFPGMVYLRSTRMELPVLYEPSEQFPVGGSKTLRSSDHDQVTLAAAGVTVHEALKAAEVLAQEGVTARVLDLYSVEPLDQTALERAADETGHIVVVEDHYPEGGLGEAVRTALANQPARIDHLAVRSLPHSGTPEENLRRANISASAIVRTALGIQP